MSQPKEKSLSYRLTEGTLRIINDILEAIVMPFSLVEDQALMPNEHFPWVKELEAAAPAIRRELEQLLSTQQRIIDAVEVTKYHEPISPDDRGWRLCYLYLMGHRLKQVCQDCPETEKAVKNIPGLMNVLFSVLEPHSHIPAHRGFYKGYARCHMGLIIPEGDVKFRVDGQLMGWEEGKAFFFDDGYEHEAWNRTDERRIILFIDVARPMTLPGRWINSLILKGIKYSPFTLDALRNTRKWERNFFDKGQRLRAKARRAGQGRVKTASATV